MSVYTIYNKKLAPDELKSKQIHAPTYTDKSIADSIDVLLFVYTLEDVTGTPADNIIDVAAMGFNHPYSEEGEGLTAEQLDGMVDNLLTSNQLGSEIQMSKPQGRYLYDTRFKPESAE